MRTLNLCIFYLTIVLLVSCNDKSEKKINSNESTSVNEKSVDSIELTKLIRAAYKWHDANKIEDFPYEFEKNKDSIFIGIDWKKYEENINIFKKQNFLSNDFLKKHKEIAMTLDASIRKADLKWRNNNDGIPIWKQMQTIGATVKIIREIIGIY
jgi:hypothetical protein